MLYILKENDVTLTCTKNEMTSLVTKMAVIRFAEINAGWFTKIILHGERVSL